VAGSISAARTRHPSSGSRGSGATIPPTPGFRPQGNLHPQPIARKPLNQHRHLFRLAIQQQRIRMGEHEKICQPLALRRQQGRPDGIPGPDGFDVIGNESLKESDAIITLDRYNASFRQRGQLNHSI
jgi:hypothetical protein